MRDGSFLPQDIGFLDQLAVQIAAALDNAKAYHEVAELTDRLKKEKLYLQDEIRSELNFEEIIGESPALTRVLSQVKTVAPSNATTLILGETGTGKELIARAIHRLSSRKDATFIKLNCAAIPTGLLESELFGHEKGAFTGAVTQKIGRLELADKGTLFLDEVGDIPSELQPKLLRVLQDQEFERLGGNRTIRVNIRLIAATNRNLAQAVAEREFRSDLYYRLNVFPIHMPALRERTKDIPLLVRYFVQKLSRRMNKQIETIPTETMNALIRWDWPGNVRELENFIERSVILTEGSVLNVPLAELRSGDLESEIDGTLENMEREFIIRVLRETSGVIAGSHGAAARLGLKRTTLQSRMLKMGISRRDYED
jgi:formate hydrogenlyase transcriptional activator